MKRSKINALMREAVAFMEEMKFKAPPFVYFSPEDWKTKGAEYNEIRDNMLGWDITDFGSGEYEKVGLLMITLRNGNFHDPKYVKPYAEKLLIVKEEQITPYHFHWSKMEDIINRGGNDIIFHLYNADRESEGLAETDVEIFRDGRCYTVPAGSEVVLKPGESLTLNPYCYHDFIIPKNGRGPALIGEVSMCNDDNTDNRFLEPLGRFPAIEEDEPVYRLLCNEYPAVKD